MEIYGVVMAGGGGTRFWPLSRQKTPKQLLNLSGKDLMVNETIDRLAMTIPGKNMFIVTNASQVESMKKATRGRVMPNHILSEPSARNTAACIGYAAVEIIKKYGDGIMVIAPSDAYIKDWDKFTDVLSVAINVAENENKLVTIGITPTFPATGYGYIKFIDKELSGAKFVEEFKEKPDLETAKKYISSGDYVWNSGMFIWKASIIMEHFKEFLPDIYIDLMIIADAMGTNEEYNIIEKIYPNIRKISIDYGIMEKSNDVLVVSGEFGWNDVGSWDMMNVLHSEDINGNISIGDVLNIDTNNTIVYSDSKLIATVGVDNLIIVQTKDAILVCDRNKAQDVKKVVDSLNELGRNELL
ncbi:MAG: mannose-1-phosphate guanylyltransferase [Anaerotignaceae bacterium]|nr:mannose-1-phosphate guanylyltransferase [Eubacterium sp.]